MTKRLAIVASHVIQYQDPLFRRIAADDAIDLTVLYCSKKGAAAFHDVDMGLEVKWDLEMLRGYDFRFLRNVGFGERWFRLVNPGIVPALTRGRFDAVIFMIGWGTFTSLLGLIACRLAGIPAFLFGDSSHPPPEKTFASRMRARLLRAILRLPRGFMVSGHLNAEYYRHYGADPARFHLQPFAIDNDRFRTAAQFAPGERGTLRARFGATSNDLVLVFSGKLVPRKDPLTLLRAVAAMRHRDRTVVLILGNGELRAALTEFAQANALRVHFAGFVNQQELPKFYAAGDVLVLPSTYEPRGLVVNEAMASGLMPVVSDRCGCIGDLAIDGDNALVFPAGDSTALARQFDRLIDDPALRERMTRRSQEIIAGWSFDRAVEGIRGALGR